MIEIEKIKLFRSLFRGRDDAFAIRWEKGNKSGYMPSSQFDPYHYRIHKAKGGTLSNCVNLVAMIYLGLYGNRLAYDKSDIRDSIFMVLQGQWNKWAIRIFWLGIAASIVGLFISG